MMAYDRAARVALAIMDLIGRIAPADALQQHIETVLRDEFWDDRREGVADRGDVTLTQDEADRIDDYVIREHPFEDDGNVPPDLGEPPSSSDPP
jgi:hypothetical protein